jgi:hypothetical protein
MVINLPVRPIKTQTNPAQSVLASNQRTYMKAETMINMADVTAEYKSRYGHDGAPDGGGVTPSSSTPIHGSLRGKDGTVDLPNKSMLFNSKYSIGGVSPSAPRHIQQHPVYAMIRVAISLKGTPMMKMARPRLCLLME